MAVLPMLRQPLPMAGRVTEIGSRIVLFLHLSTFSDGERGLELAKAGQDRGVFADSLPKEAMVSHLSACQRTA
eukprot:8567556-Alexandrium_andersonii.AAC.1